MILTSSQPNVGALVEREEKREDAGREDGDAAVVDLALAALRLVSGDHPPGDEDAERGDRQIEEEDPAPAQAVGQHAAEQRADGIAEAGGRRG